MAVTELATIFADASAVLLLVAVFSWLASIVLSRERVTRAAESWGRLGYCFAAAGVLLLAGSAILDPPQQEEISEEECKRADTAQITTPPGALSI